MNSSNRGEGVDRRGSIPRPAVYELSALTTELLTRADAAVKRSCDEAGKIERTGSVGEIRVSVIALSRKGNVSRKACENLPGVETRLYVKSEVRVCRNVSVISGHTDTPTDRRTRPYKILDLEDNYSV